MVKYRHCCCRSCHCRCCSTCISGGVWMWMGVQRRYECMHKQAILRLSVNWRERLFYLCNGHWHRTPFCWSEQSFIQPMPQLLMTSFFFCDECERVQLRENKSIIDMIMFNYLCDTRSDGQKWRKCEHEFSANVLNVCDCLSGLWSVPKGAHWAWIREIKIIAIVSHSSKSPFVHSFTHVIEFYAVSASETFKFDATAVSSLHL